MMERKKKRQMEKFRSKGDMHTLLEESQIEYKKELKITYDEQMLNKCKNTELVRQLVKNDSLTMLELD